MKAAAVVAATLVLAACDRPGPMALPADPGAFVRTGRYAFGDLVHGRDVRAWTAALDLLEPRYGKLRVGPRVLPAITPVDAVRAELAARLGARGWMPVPELARWPRVDGSYAFGWSKGDRVYAIVGLEHRPTDMASSPVNVVTNIGDPADPL